MDIIESRGTNNQPRQTESLADLPLTTEQEEETKAGASRSSGNSTSVADSALLGSFLAFPGFTGGVSVASGDVN